MLFCQVFLGLTGTFNLGIRTLCVIFGGTQLVFVFFYIFYVILTLEGEPKVDEEGVLQLGEDVDLPQDVLECVSLQTLRLVHVLHGVHLFRVLLLNNAHLRKLPK